MKSSPIFPGDEAGNSIEAGHDPQLYFSVFSEEAKRHENDANFSPPPSISAKNTAAEIDEPTRKSWKSYLSFWFKFQNKIRMRRNRPKNASSNGSRIRNLKKRCSCRFSGGRIFRDTSKLALIHRKFRRAASGPLSDCFNPTRGEENAVPYRCLDQQNFTLGGQAFGPIYLVT